MREYTKTEEAMEVAQALEGLEKEDVKEILTIIRGYKLKVATLQNA